MSSKTHPLYNTTYTLHRLSPLHAFPPLASTAALTQHAKSLLSILRGDVLRGVRVRDDNEDDDDALGRAGRLKNVTWEPLRSPRRWRQPPDGNDDDDDDDDESPLGVLIELAYDHATYTALLLLAPSPAPAPGPAGAFTALPLLLTRLPRSLRSALLGYLAASFDTQAQALALDSRVLKRLLEAWLGVVFAAGDGDGNGNGDAGRDVQIVFSAPAGVVTVKAVTVTVLRGDVAGFWRRGRRMLAAGEAGEAGEGAFFEALRCYALGTMGLDITALGVMKVACGGFVLGAGAGAAAAGKVKVFAPRSGGGGERAAEVLVGGLVEASLVAVLK